MQYQQRFPRELVPAHRTAGIFRAQQPAFTGGFVPSQHEEGEIESAHLTAQAADAEDEGLAIESILRKLGNHLGYLEIGIF